MKNYFITRVLYIIIGVCKQRFIFTKSDENAATKIIIIHN